MEKQIQTLESLATLGAGNHGRLPLQWEKILQALMSRQPVKEGIPYASESFFAIQRPGDIVYVPEAWSHSVLNCTLAVAVSVEIEFMKYRRRITRKVIAYVMAASLPCMNPLIVSA